jgi:WD40 repeat protein
MRPNLCVLILLASLLPPASAQSARQERIITLPDGVSAEFVAASPTGNLVAAICSDNVARVWSARSAELLRSLDQSEGLPLDLQFSGDGRLLAVAYEIVAYEKGTIKVFDVDSWKVRHVLSDSPPMWSLSFSPDGRRLAGAGAFDTYIWDLPAQKSLAKMSPPFGGSNSLSFSADGTRISTSDGDTCVRWYDAETGELRGVVSEFLLEQQASAFMPDGRTLLVGGANQSISFIDVASARVSRAIPKQPGIVTSIDLSPDGKQAAVAYRLADHFHDVNQLALWDLVKGTPLAIFQTPGISEVGGAFVGDHYLFAAASGNKLTLWSFR